MTAALRLQNVNIIGIVQLRKQSTRVEVLPFRGFSFKLFRQCRRECNEDVAKEEHGLRQASTALVVAGGAREYASAAGGATCRSNSAAGLHDSDIRLADHAEPGDHVDTAAPNKPPTASTQAIPSPFDRLSNTAMEEHHAEGDDLPQADCQSNKLGSSKHATSDSAQILDTKGSISHAMHSTRGSTSLALNSTSSITPALMQPSTPIASASCAVGHASRTASLPMEATTSVTTASGSQAVLKADRLLNTTDSCTTDHVLQQQQQQQDPDFYVWTVQGKQQQQQREQQQHQKQQGGFGCHASAGPAAAAKAAFGLNSGSRLLRDAVILPAPLSQDRRHDRHMLAGPASLDLQRPGPKSGEVIPSPKRSAGGNSPHSNMPRSQLCSAAAMRFSMDDADTRSQGMSSPAMSVSGAFAGLAGERERPTYTPAGLQRALEKLMLRDEATFARVQASMKGISSLAKETTTLALGHDCTGAAIMNQYVIVKTLGRGSFGKVKLCLNTLDGQLYAVKMVNRAFVLRQLQKPARGLRRRTPRAVVSNVQLPVARSSANKVAPTHSASFGAMPRYSVDETNRHTETSMAGSSSTSPQSTATSTQPPGSAGPLESVMREIAVLKRLDHPNVVRLHEIIDPPGHDYMMVVMQYMEKGSVLETKAHGVFESFAEHVALSYFRQVCCGLDYLHYNSVVHGDLKPENLLLSATGDLKIGDFGSSRIINNMHACSKVSCTPAFQPPEALQGGTVPEDPFAADIWALGVCLYCFVYGRLPFRGSCVLNISKAIMQAEVEYPAEVPVSDELLDLFSRIFIKDPAERITLQDIMAHPWTSVLGSAPLLSIKAQGAPPLPIQATPGQALQAIDHVSLVSLIRARLKEKTCQPGEYLFREHDEAHCIYMIMSGRVEMVRHAVPNVDLGVLDNLQEGGITLDVDESFSLDCGIAELPAGALLRDGKLHIDKDQAAGLKSRMREMILGREGVEYVGEVRGPGQVIGEVSLDKERVARHHWGARAIDQVTVVKLTEENLVKALTQSCGSEASQESALQQTLETLLVSMADVSVLDSGSNAQRPANSPALQAQSSHAPLATIHDDLDDPNVGSL